MGTYQVSQRGRGETGGRRRGGGWINRDHTTRESKEKKTPLVGDVQDFRDFYKEGG